MNEMTYGTRTSDRMGVRLDVLVCLFQCHADDIKNSSLRI